MVWVLCMYVCVCVCVRARAWLVCYLIASDLIKIGKLMEEKQIEHYRSIIEG